MYQCVGFKSWLYCRCYSARRHVRVWCGGERHQLSTCLEEVEEEPVYTPFYECLHYERWDAHISCSHMHQQFLFLFILSSHKELKYLVDSVGPCGQMQASEIERVYLRFSQIDPANFQFSAQLTWTGMKWFNCAAVLDWMLQLWQWNK